MTMLTFTYAAKQVDGAHAVHLYVAAHDPTYTDFPKEEREAAREASSIVSELVGNGCGSTSLLQDGPLPDDSIPVFTFALGVYWDKHVKLPHYTKIGYERLLQDGKWNPVASVAMEQYDYIMRVIRSRENASRKASGKGTMIVPSFTCHDVHMCFRRFCDELRPRLR